MTYSSILIQFLNGLASASSLFLVAAGLSLIFGVTRIVNFAHGSLYMLGMYVAVWLGERIGFWWSVPIAALAVGAFGALVESALLRRLYAAPELLQLLATFALVLVVKDFALWAWGPEDILGPRAPGFTGAVTIAGLQFPEYDLFLIGFGPLVLGALWLLLTRTRWGTLVRAATQDREMASALGVNQKWLFTGVFALGAFLAGLGGALQIPREPATLLIDLSVVSDAFVVVVVGGLGSIGGAFVAAFLIAEIKAFCIGLGLSQFTLVVEFVVMAVVLVIRPWGLFGRMPALARGAGAVEPPLVAPSPAALKALAALLAALALVPVVSGGYTLVLLTDILVFALFAVSLHFIMGPAGLHSFGHAAYFGLGAYGAGLLLLRAGAPMELALLLGPLAGGLGALVFGWFCVRLSGVYLAMLTLAFAQIAWSVVFQWDAFTGGSNGLVGIWPASWLASKAAYYYITLLTCAGGIALLWRMLYAPFGYALRAARDSPLRADAIGLDVRALQWAAFTLAGLAAGMAGALYAFSKGSISPESLSVPRSVDGLVMVLLGGIQTLTGPLWGAALFTWMQDAVARGIDYWRAVIGAVILVLVLAFPQGLTGFLRQRFAP
ncbi:MAG: ABC transporter permease [Betaproteobacteria bacterium RIFCSPLOWO2_02_67_12]|nr:MAG: ABC transporter permease [Betaproteobacteria bacterium RIFCSPLOWO2_02_67_12]OGA31102.1 MAG: ABC transporter permease [Betaproteobacteria bacterium RIFCSPLOWO2_02_FULL_68_150]OGA55132.1 MAG: ABC transporter permease [Betaproteobacteria bacterium RIFCSPLOWO2_12_FULL_67_28]